METTFTVLQMTHQKLFVYCIMGKFSIINSAVIILKITWKYYEKMGSTKAMPLNKNIGAHNSSWKVYKLLFKIKSLMEKMNGVYELFCAAC